MSRDGNEEPSDVLCEVEWMRLVDAVSPSAILVVIHHRMGPVLRAAMNAEDLWQEALIHSWRDRHLLEDRSPTGFRRWVMRIIEHRIQDALDRETAQKRGAGVRPLPLAMDSGSTGGTSNHANHLPPHTTTPSRVAAWREEAARLEAALDRLPEDLREIVRLRLFEEMPLKDIAERLGIGVSGVRHRFRRGGVLFEEILARESTASVSARDAR